MAAHGIYNPFLAGPAANTYGIIQLGREELEVEER